jgi:hypothetical protein
MDTSVLQEHITSIFRVEVSRVGGVSMHTEGMCEWIRRSVWPVRFRGWEGGDHTQDRLLGTAGPGRGSHSRMY